MNFQELKEKNQEIVNLQNTLYSKSKESFLPLDEAKEVIEIFEKLGEPDEFKAQKWSSKMLWKRKEIEISLRLWETRASIEIFSVKTKHIIRLSEEELPLWSDILFMFE